MRETRNALRQLVRAPAFTVTAVVVLSLAIGSGAAVSSLLNALLFRELPVPSPGDLVQVTTIDRRSREGELTWEQFRGLRERQTAFASVIGSISQGMVTLEARERAVRVSVAGVTDNYFAELGAAPVLGRFFDPSEVDVASRAGAPVAVLGWSCWQRHFGGDAGVVGQSVRVQGVPVTVVGIAPPRFLGLGLTLENDVTVPLTTFPGLFEGGSGWFDGAIRWVSVTGRLRPGLSLESARAEAAALWPSLRDDVTPAGLAGPLRDDYRGLQVQVASGARGVERGLRARYSQPLYALLAIAILIGLLAVLNVGSLAFVRTESARHELGIRLALGATRLRVVRELTVQGLLLGGAGGVGAILCGGVAADAIAAFVLRDYAVPTSLAVSPHAGLVVAILGASVTMGGIITAAVAWAATSPTRTTLAAGGNRSVARSSRLGRGLVAAQSALAIVVLANVSLLATNLQRLSAADAALSGEEMLIATPTERPGAYRALDPAVYYREALARVAAVPGVAAAAFSQHRPQWDTISTERIGRSGVPAASDDRAAATTRVSPGFFHTIGLPVVEGRDFSYEDTDRTDPIVILSSRLATRLFGNAPATGQRIRMGDAPDLQAVLVVGVIGDARVFNVRDDSLAMAYRPALQAGRAAHLKTLVVRAPAHAARGIQQAIDSLGVETVTSLQTFADARGRALSQERIMATLGGGLGLVALVLVAVGLYGLLTYVLSLRRKEMGIRMALGAEASSIGAGIIVQGLYVSGAGMLVGLAAALPSAQLLRSVLTSVGAFEPVPLLAAAGSLLLAALLASLGPARRAARVQPLAELRRD